jgi:hypothetical protein
MKENMTRRNRTKIMPRKVGLAVCRSANVKLKLPILINRRVFGEIFIFRNIDFSLHPFSKLRELPEKNLSSNVSFMSRAKNIKRKQKTF